MRQHPLGLAAHHQSLESAGAMGAHHDQVGTGFFGRLQNALMHLALRHNELLRFDPVLIHHRLRGSQLFGGAWISRSAPSTR